MQMRRRCGGARATRASRRPAAALRRLRPASRDSNLDAGRVYDGHFETAAARSETMLVTTSREFRCECGEEARSSIAVVDGESRGGEPQMSRACAWIQR